MQSQNTNVSGRLCSCQDRSQEPDAEPEIFRRRLFDDKWS